MDIDMDDNTNRGKGKDHSWATRNNRREKGHIKRIYITGSGDNINSILPGDLQVKISNELYHLLSDQIIKPSFP